MLDAIGAVLPFGLAVALSSIPILATTVILLSPNRDLAIPPFTTGWLIGIFLMALVFTAGFGALPRETNAAREAVLGWIGVALGFSLVVFAGYVWRRTSHSQQQSTPKWLGAVERLGPLAAFGLALGLNVRPKAVLISAAVGLAIHTTDAGTSDSLVALAVYTAIGASAVLTPVVYTYTSPDRSERMLLSMRAWLTTNSAVITVTVVAMTGVVVLGNGLGRL